MSVKLRVVNEDDDQASPSEYMFDQNRITIGRGTENHLTLDDPERIVSTEHAEIRREEETYHLVDRGSKNFTFLEGQRLEAGEPHPLQDGDVFSIGNFEIEFAALEPSDSSSSPSDSADETVLAADFTNPFMDPAELNEHQARVIVCDAHNRIAERMHYDSALDDTTSLNLT